MKVAGLGAGRDTFWVWVAGNVPIVLKRFSIVKEFSVEKEEKWCIKNRQGKCEHPNG
jgi:hypothetical protein